MREKIGFVTQVVVLEREKDARRLQRDFGTEFGFVALVTLEDSFTKSTTESRSI